MNTSAEKMLNLKSADILNKNFKTLLKGHHLRLAEGICKA
jgi:signal transduction histidine kinase